MRDLEQAYKEESQFYRALDRLLLSELKSLEWFEFLCRQINKEFKTEYSFVGRIFDKERVRDLSLVNNDKTVDNFEYLLEGNV